MVNASSLWLGKKQQNRLSQRSLLFFILTGTETGPRFRKGNREHAGNVHSVKMIPKCFKYSHCNGLWRAYHTPYKPSRMINIFPLSDMLQLLQPLLCDLLTRNFVKGDGNCSLEMWMEQRGRYWHLPRHRVRICPGCFPGSGRSWWTRHRDVPSEKERSGKEDLGYTAVHIQWLFAIPGSHILL